MVLKPPPLAPKASFHVVSEPYAPLIPLARRLVPPTLVTSGSLAGVPADLKRLLPSQGGCAAPLSPDDANRVVPFWVALLKSECCWASSVGFMQASASPKLCEITSPRLWSMAYFVALRMSASSFVLAITRSIVAAGAITCAHSTSSEVSTPQPKRLPESVAPTPFGG